MHICTYNLDGAYANHVTNGLISEELGKKKDAYEADSDFGHTGTNLAGL